ncbi:MAG: dTDP-4-dehydrorhamnose 3,5-epimerase [Pseudomonadota bacterium]
MEVARLSIPDVIVLTPRKFADDRGYFMETYSARSMGDALGEMAFVQDNESFSSETYTVRGLHYQAPPYAQDKLVRVIRGRIFDVVVDVRKGSPTYGKWVGAELSAENRAQLLAPRGFLHGFMTLEPDCLVAYKVSAFYDGPSDGGVRFDSPDLGIAWPGPTDKAVLSDKDKAAPDFSAFESPFV